MDGGRLLTVIVWNCVICKYCDYNLWAGNILRKNCEENMTCRTTDQVVFVFMHQKWNKKFWMNEMKIYMKLAMQKKYVNLRLQASHLDRELSIFSHTLCLNCYALWRPVTHWDALRRTSSALCLTGNAMVMHSTWFSGFGKLNGQTNA